MLLIIPDIKIYISDISSAVEIKVYVRKVSFSLKIFCFNSCENSDCTRLELEHHISLHGLSIIIVCVVTELFLGNPLSVPSGYKSTVNVEACERKAQLYRPTAKLTLYQKCVC